VTVRATREAFQALRADGKAEIPANLRTLYLRLPTALAVRYCRRVLAGPRGDLCARGSAIDGLVRSSFVRGLLAM
jgi:hypothetical protein